MSEKIFILLVISLFYLFLARKIWQKKTFELLVNLSYMFFSFSIGFLNYAFFRWYFQLGVFVEALDMPFYLWAFSTLVYFFLFYILIVKHKTDFNHKLLVPEYLKRVSLIFMNLVTVVGCLYAFKKGGSIPLFAPIVDVARSEMAKAGMVSTFFFIHVYTASVLFCNFLIFRKEKGSLKYVEALFGFVSISFILMYAMRSYLLIVVLTVLFFLIRHHNLLPTFKKLLFYGLIAGIFLQVFGSFRSSQKTSTDLTLNVARFFSGTFSEFREWPYILDHPKIQGQSPLVGAASTVVPSSVFEIFGVEKKNYLFSSGLFYRDLLSRNWQGDNLGLRTTLYGDLFLSWGIYAFLFLPVLLVLFIRWMLNFAQRKKSSDAYVLYCVLLLTITVTFSSELSTLVIKLYILGIFLLVKFVLQVFLEKMFPYMK